MDMDDQKIKLYFSTVKCAHYYFFRNIGLSLFVNPLTYDLEDFKSIFDLMRSNLGHCDAKRDIEKQKA